jgi:PBP1b-binding outer membrane lipoprotein LpoB
MAIILLIVTIVLTGCKPQASETKKYELEGEEVEVEEVAPIEEDLLAPLVTDIQDEMRVFDVVAHHDTLMARIKDEVSTELDTEEMTVHIRDIVTSYMDKILLDRIEEGLSKIQDPYSEEDVKWVRSQINTDDLYHLITIYEREFYKRELAQ